MPARDFALLCLICLVWGLNLVVSRFVVVDVPPLFYAAMRFALLAAVLLPWLLPVPRQWRLVTIVGLCIGGLHFTLLFLALEAGTASSVAIAGQLGLPFTTSLSMLFLGEQVRWRRGLGMALAFFGVAIISVDPAELDLSVGVALGALAALVGSIGGVVMKRMEPIGSYQLQAWVAVVSLPLLAPATLFTEAGQLEAVARMGWPFWAALAFSVFAVSIFGHGMFYWLVKRHEVTLLSPLTLMTPIWAVIFAVLLLGEPLTAQLLVGGAIALTGVGIVAARPNFALREAGALWRRWMQ